MRVLHVARLRTVGPAVPEDLPEIGHGRVEVDGELVPLHLRRPGGSSDCTDAARPSSQRQLCSKCRFQSTITSYIHQIR